MICAALFSGGKDSTLAARIAEEKGYQLSYLVSMKSTNPDSYMFHTANIELTKLQAQAWGVEHIVGLTSGIKEKEIEDLRKLLMGLEIEAVVSGAIASNYQRTRVDSLCKDLEITHYSPLWRRNREDLLREIIQRGMKVIFTAVAAQGLDKRWLGRKLNNESIKELLRLNTMYGLDPCGEGGEYESIVLDAPWFNESIGFNVADTTWDGMSGRLFIRDAHLTKK
jgi:diphthine-ammonia ligase